MAMQSTIKESIQWWEKYLEYFDKKLENQKIKFVTFRLNKL